MPTARITSKGQVVIPKAVRDRLGLKSGDTLDFIVQEGGEIVVRPAVHDVRELKGVLYRKGQSVVTVEAMKQTIRQRSRRIRRKNDFSDYYLGIANEEEGAEVTLTFDKALKESRHLKVLAN